ncbi:putative minor histocompatibility antigen H13-like protein [Cutibacterium acnes HL042PA3]|nr:putative minor histocompatibility antigen H13-like protein [Cutibacterium acnes HL042PA3]
MNKTDPVLKRRRTGTVAGVLDPLEGVKGGVVSPLLKNWGG